MKCSDTEQYIQMYIDDRLTGSQLREFLTHIEECPKCYEEMEINYLIKEALIRLEDGTTFDLQKELQQKIQNSKNCLFIHEYLVAVRQLVLLATLVMLGVSIVRILIVYGVGI